MKRNNVFVTVIALSITALGILLAIINIIDFIDFFLMFSIITLSMSVIGFLSRNQNKIICDKCYYKNPNNSTNCIKCGNDIENIICPTCKGVNQYNQKYCTECETKLVCGECSI